MLLALTLLAASPDSRWVELRRMGSDRFFLDAYSMPAERGKSGSPWIKVVHDKAKPTGETEHLWRYAISCSAHSIATLTSISFYADGTTQRSDVPLNQARFLDPAPETLGEYLTSLLCSK